MNKKKRMKSNRTMDFESSIDPKRLLKGLNSFNERLSFNGETIEMVVIGSMAIELNGIELNRQTRDIDLANDINLDLYEKEIQSIKRELNFPDTEWINNRSSTIFPWPKGMKDRLICIDKFSNINLKVAAIDDLKSFKISALYTREEERDFDDLITMDVSKKDIDRGIEYLKDIIIYNHGETFLKKDESLIEAFKEDLYDRFIRL